MKSCDQSNASPSVVPFENGISTLKIDEDLKASNQTPSCRSMLTNSNGPGRAKSRFVRADRLGPKVMLPVGEMLRSRLFGLVCQNSTAPVPVFTIT